MNVHVPTSFCRREYDQWYLEMRSVRACFYDVTTQNALFLCTGNVRACFFDVTTRIPCFCLCKTVESTDLESLEISCRQMNSWSHIFVFVVTAFSVVACVLLHAHPSLRTAQGGHYLSFGRCV